MMSQSVWKIAAIISILNFTQAWRLVCFKGSINNSNYVTFENAIQQIISGYINTSKPTVMCFHGFGGNTNTQGTNLLINAYLQRDINVCACDYSKEAAIGPILELSYIFAVVKAAYEVAREVAIALVNMVPRGFNVKTLHMVGFSLGAHVCGNAGEFYKTMTGNTIGRITGLDPAAPGFIFPFPRLRQGNADFVDTIHTDPGVGRNGMADAIADQDFFPCPIEYDETGVQPGCAPVIPFVTKRLSAEDVCSHLRVVFLFLETLISGIRQLAAKADSKNAWASPSFVLNQFTCAGEYTNQTYSGKFYYRTSDNSPFGLGEAGLTAQ